MENKTITEDEIKSMKMALATYYHFKKMEQIELKEAFYLDELLKDEMKGSAISYDSIGNGCSVSFPTGSYLETLALEKAAHDLEAQHYKYIWMPIEKHMFISKRFEKLKDKQKNIIINVFKEETPITSLAEKASVSRQTYTKRIDNIITTMLEVEL